MNSSREKIGALLDKIDNIQKNITDAEYKEMVDLLGNLHVEKKKSKVFSKITYIVPQITHQYENLDSENHLELGQKVCVGYYPFRTEEFDEMKRKISEQGFATLHSYHLPERRDHIFLGKINIVLSKMSCDKCDCLECDCGDCGHSSTETVTYDYDNAILVKIEEVIDVYH